jgi:hypothetical protein
MTNGGRAEYRSQGSVSIEGPIQGQEPVGSLGPNQTRVHHGQESPCLGRKAKEKSGGSIHDKSDGAALAPGEHRLLVVGDPFEGAFESHSAKLQQDGAGRSVDEIAADGYLDDGAVGFRDGHEAG